MNVLIRESLLPVSERPSVPYGRLCSAVDSETSVPVVTALQPLTAPEFLPTVTQHSDAGVSGADKEHGGVLKPGPISKGS